MSPAQYRGWLALRGPVQTHRHITAVGSAGRERPRPQGRRPWPAARAVVRVQPLPAFTTSRMSNARKGSTGCGPGVGVSDSKAAEEHNTSPPFLRQLVIKITNAAA